MLNLDVSLSFRKESIPEPIRGRILTGGALSSEATRRKYLPGAEPFLTYPGGKRSLLGQYSQLLPAPARYDTYIEACVGGGAVFFHLQGTGALAGKRVILNDINPEITNAWLQLQLHPEEMRAAKQRTNLEVSKKRYLEIRDIYNWQRAKLSPLERALYLIFLSRISRGGYRVNGQNHFDLPFGDRSPNTDILSDAELNAVTSALAGVTISNRDYGFVEDETICPESALVFFDPIYYAEEVITGAGRIKQAAFTSYLPGGIHSLELLKLHQTMRQLAERGPFVMVSNDFHPTVLIELAGPLFNCAAVYRFDAANTKGKERGFKPECVFRNFRTKEDRPYLAEVERLKEIQQMKEQEVLSALSQLAQQKAAPPKGPGGRKPVRLRFPPGLQLELLLYD
jgi:DNA adenine methylase